MRLGELRKIDAHERVLAAEERLGQRLRELGLADAARPAEEEAAQRFARIVQAGARAPDRFGDRGDGAVLPDYAARQQGVELQQPIGLRFGQRSLRNAGPTRDDGGDVVAGNARRVDLTFVEQRDGCRGFVDQVDGLIGQKTIRDVARRERCSRFDRVVADGDVVVQRVAFAQSA